MVGSCGVGPNLVILPVEMIVNHCNTAAHAARLLALQCGAENPDGNYPKAEKLYSEVCFSLLVFHFSHLLAIEGIRKNLQTCDRASKSSYTCWSTHLYLGFMNGNSSQDYEQRGCLVLQE
jgi:hypothetical protein